MRAVVDQDHAVLERWADMADADTTVVLDAHLGGYPVSVLGIESRAIPRRGRFPADGPDQWTSGTLFPQSSKKTARAINAASGNRPLVVLANLSGFDGSPESLRKIQLEYGAEIGRAIVNFDGPIIFCVISRYHGGAFVVFSGVLNENMEVIAVEGSFASVIGGAPAAAVVFSRDVATRTAEDPRVVAMEAELAGAAEGDRPALRAELAALRVAVRSEKLGEVAGGVRAGPQHRAGACCRVGGRDHPRPRAPALPHRRRGAGHRSDRRRRPTRGGALTVIRACSSCRHKGRIMQPFLVNRHDRIVFPSNFAPELDLSVMHSLEQLDSVIRRDFEVKAPTGTDILDRIEGGDYASRYELLRDLALNLFWTNRFALTLYEKRPTRWSDVPRTRTDVFMPILTPWEDGDRKIAAVQGRLRDAADDLGRGGGGSHLRDPLRRVRPPQAPRQRSAHDQADGRRDPFRPQQSHLPAAQPRRGLPGLRLRRHRRLCRGGPRARGAAAGGPWCCTTSTRGTVRRPSSSRSASCRTTTTSCSSTRGTRRSGTSSGASERARCPHPAPRPGTPRSRSGPTRR